MSGDEERVYFIHGTTTALWDGGTAIDATRGGGDFGAGFYVFEDTGWGRQAATVWARRKAVDVGGVPVLMRLAVSRPVFAALDRADVPDDALDLTYQRYAYRRLTGRALVVGPVGKNGLDGRRVPDKRWPVQYKFEGDGIAKLALDSVIRLTPGR
ncbi:MAG TPA: hypothetical protein VFW96_12120 [Thermomicrobiales bacterium]|nr:hypothetical protein [Thermomicrobiales bacterium]